jgi:hypothetical protein
MDLYAVHRHDAVALLQPCGMHGTVWIYVANSKSRACVEPCAVWSLRERGLSARVVCIDTARWKKHPLIHHTHTHTHISVLTDQYQIKKLACMRAQSQDDNIC